jgi:hypothetical protein
MKRRFRWPSRTGGDGGATDTSSASREVRVPQQTSVRFPERPKPHASVVTPSSSSQTPNLSARPLLPSSSTSASRVASTPTPQRQDGISSDANASKKDYWQLAVDQLQEEDSTVAEQITGVQRAAAAAGNADFAAQLLHITQQGRQELELKRWKIITGSREIVLRDQFDRLVKAVTLFKDVGNAAASIDPLHAGLPLAGFCVLMQVGLVDIV